ncbi:MAG: MFS transporter [Spirochaetales bacterium]|nr:MFS transporter [Spirochaetales bacterium]
MSHDNTVSVTSEERRRGTRLFFQSSFFNGFAFAFLADSIVQLIAIHFGATNLQLGYLASAIHVSGFVMLIVPVLLGGRKIVTVYFLFWLLRGLLSLGYGGVVFLDGQPAVVLILVVYTLFAVSRNIGTAMDSPLKHILFPVEKRGKRISRNLFWFQASRLLGRLGSYLLFMIDFFNSILGLVFIQYLGVVFNSITAVLIKKIPVQERVEKTSLGKVATIAMQIVHHKEQLMILCLYLVTMVAFIFVSLLVAFQRRVLEYSETTVLLIQFFASCGYIAATVVAPKFIDKIKSIPVLLVAFGSQILCMGILIFIPVDIHIAIMIILVVIMYFVHSILFIMSNKLLLGIIPVADKIGFSVVVNFSTAIAALVFGAAAGGLADISEANSFTVSHIYSLSFNLGGLVCVIGFFCTIILYKYKQKKLIDI